MDRARIHAAVDTFLDALDEYRRAPVEEELVRVRDLPLEERARTDLIRDGHLRAVKIGRELWTRRSELARLIDVLPSVNASKPDDEVAAAARRRAARRVA